MRKVKKFAALGLSVMMVSSMAVGVNAASQTADTTINKAASGNTTVEASGDIAVDGYLTKDAVIDSNGEVSRPSGSDYNPSVPTEVPTVTSTTGSDGQPTQTSTMTSTITATSGNTPIDSNGSHVSWGDASTADTTQLILSAPTKLAFQVAGNEEEANIQLTSSGETVTGYILNQSCYIQNDSDLTVVPKEVAVKGMYAAPANAAFEIVDAIQSADTTQVAGVNLGLEGTINKKYTSFASMKGAARDLGILEKGAKAYTDTGKAAVNPSATKIYFSDNQGKATGVSTKFASTYDGSKLNQAYNVQLTYTVQ